MGAVLGGVVLLGLSFWFYRVGLFLLGVVSGIVIVAVVLSMKDEAMFGAWKYAVFAGAAILLGVAAVLLERPSPFSLLLCLAPTWLLLVSPSLWTPVYMLFCKTYFETTFITWMPPGNRGYC